MYISRILDLAGAGTCLFFILATAIRIPNHAGKWVAVGVGLIIGYFAADLLSGIVHWFCDTCFSETTPGIGKRLIHPFREHHRDPAAMTRHSLLELTGNSGWGALPVTLPVCYADAGVGFDSFAVSCGTFLMLTNIFHKWAHMTDVNPLIRKLQRVGCILSPRTHERHHVTGRGAYCVMNGWMNPLLDRLTGVR